MRENLYKDVKELLKSYVLSILNGGTDATSAFKSNIYELSLDELFKCYENRDNEEFRKAYYNKIFSKTWALPDNN